MSRAFRPDAEFTPGREAEGLGTCWMSGVLTREKELLKFLDMEDRHLLTITPIGYSAKPRRGARKDRPVRWLGF